MDGDVCAHRDGAVYGQLRGLDRQKLSHSGLRPYALVQAALSHAPSDAKACGNASTIPSKAAARKIVYERTNANRLDADLVTSLERSQKKLRAADGAGGRVLGQLHDVEPTDVSLSFSLYHTTGIRLLHTLSSLPGGLMCDFTGGLCSNFVDSHGDTHKMLNFLLVAPSYSHDSPVLLFEHVTTDGSGNQLLVAFRRFLADFLKEMGHDLFIKRMTFDCAPHILSAMALALNHETTAEYIARRWAEARRHEPNAANKTCDDR